MTLIDRVPPVKTAVRNRISPLLAQTQKAREDKTALLCDPLVRLAEAMPMLGNPSYATVRSWIATGQLRVWRAGHGHFRVRLSEVQRFLNDNEVKSG